MISGPNGGSNLADGWFGSGTIGAARAAAYPGLPSVALSGLDSDSPEQVAALADWIARVARRDHIVSEFDVSRVAMLHGNDDEVTSVRTVQAQTSDALIEPEGDISLYEGNWVVVTPMRTDEHAEDLLGHSSSLHAKLPDRTRHD